MHCTPEMMIMIIIIIIIIIFIHAFITRASSVMILNQRRRHSLGGQHSNRVDGLFEKVSFQVMTMMMIMTDVTSVRTLCMVLQSVNLAHTNCSYRANVKQIPALGVVASLLLLQTKTDQSKFSVIIRRWVARWLMGWVHADIDQQEDVNLTLRRAINFHCIFHTRMSTV